MVAPSLKTFALDRTFAEYTMTTHGFQTPSEPTLFVALNVYILTLSYVLTNNHGHML